MTCEDFPCCGHEQGDCSGQSWGYTPRRRRSNRSRLTPPAELVGNLVTWTPKDARGRRTTRQVATVTGYDPAARTLTVEQSKPVSPWSPAPTRVATVPLSHGPFTIA
jgi:hypothetical protein